MSPDTALLLWALVLFEVKHFVCEFVLQKRNPQLKAIYGNRFGLIHAGTHALASLPAIFVLTDSAMLIGGIVVAEFVAHYHIDWLKAWLIKRRGLQYGNRLYWILFGADQLAHQITYVIILAVLARSAGF